MLVCPKSKSGACGPQAKRHHQPRQRAVFVPIFILHLFFFLLLLEFLRFHSQYRECRCYCCSAHLTCDVSWRKWCLILGKSTSVNRQRYRRLRQSPMRQALAVLCAPKTFVGGGGRQLRTVSFLRVCDTSKQLGGYSFIFHEWLQRNWNDFFCLMTSLACLLTVV